MVAVSMLFSVMGVVIVVVVAMSVVVMVVVIMVIVVSSEFSHRFWRAALWHRKFWRAALWHRKKSRRSVDGEEGLKVACWGFCFFFDDVASGGVVIGSSTAIGNAVLLSQS